MNPLDWHGPAFLGFYLLVSVAVNLLFRLWCRGGATAASATIDPNDPYEIAYLRGGNDEALRVATFSLFDRGLLEVDADYKLASKPRADATVRRPVEKALLRFFATKRDALDMFKDGKLAIACSLQFASLVRRGLSAGPSERNRRLVAALVAAALLGGLSLAKIGVALSRGRTNIEFLVVATVFAVYFLFPPVNDRRTALGERAIRDVQGLFARLKARSSTVRPGGATNEATLIAAVFGLEVLPTLFFPQVQLLIPKAVAKGAGVGSSGTSCSTISSCASSCSSSCGGGGGCGGCGS